ncbi:MAG: DUF3105 domain-containing protein [Anaerolineales bacterium]|nr:DUF3105 domain-containing protein [Anaerolineales bacterium]
MAKRKPVQQQRNIPATAIIIGIIAVLFVGVLLYAVWDSTRPAPELGVAIPIAGREHISFGEKAVDHNSDPPTSGQHYDAPASPGYYEVAPPDEQLVHSLEHGYVVAYFNCEADPDVDCDNLIAEIQEEIRGEAISRFTRTQKIIFAPRPSMDNLVTYTSWGRILEADEFDPNQMREYITLYLDDAPEPGAP